MTLGRQLHVDERPPDPKLIDPPRQAAGHPFQPAGGLWTSTWLGEPRGSAWVQNIRPWQPLPARGWLLEPRVDARLAVIDSRADLLVLGERYGWIDYHYV